MAAFSKSDLLFILDQIRIAEAHAAGQNLLDLVPNTELPFGLRTVDGSFNNLVQGQTEFGAADNIFPRMLDPVFQDAANRTGKPLAKGCVSHVGGHEVELALVVELHECEQQFSSGCLLGE